MNLITENFNYLRLRFTVLMALILSTSVFADQDTFNKVCNSCHSGGFKGFVTGAPNIENRDEWIAYHEQHNAQQMRAIVLEGLNDHKVKGGCKKCSDESIVSAVDFMIAETQ